MSKHAPLAYGSNSARPDRKLTLETLEDRRLLAVDFDLVADVNPRPVQTSGYGVPDNRLVALGNAAYYAASDGQTLGIWKSDGTPSGTILLKQLSGTGTLFGALNYPNGSLITTAGGQLFFTGYDEAGQGPLWKSDGTVQGTSPVPLGEFFQNGSFHEDGFVTDMAALDDRLLLRRTSNQNAAPSAATILWETDGTMAGSHGFVAGPGDAVITPPGFFGKLYFSGDSVLAEKDVTGFVEVATETNEARSSTYSSVLAQVDGMTFFIGNDGVHGRELWKSDGTPAGTVMVIDLTPGSGSTSIGPIAPAGGGLYFAAGDELYSSDGTAAGTMQLDLPFVGTPFIIRTDPGSPEDLLLFTQVVNQSGGLSRSLWATDVTPAGTTKLADIYSSNFAGYPNFSIEEFAEVDGHLVFSVFVGGLPTGNYQLWSTDGTVAGTVVLREEARSSYPFHRLRFPVEAGGQVFFLFWDDRGADALYKTDGTIAGTSLVKPIVGTESANPSPLADLNGTIFFTINSQDDYVVDPGETNIVLTDGTPSGTSPLAVSPALGALTAQRLIRIGDRIVFVGSAYSVVNGHDSHTPWALWVTDGTTSGTHPLLSIDSPVIDDDERLVRLGDALYFLAKDDANGVELWRTDGTAAGTVRLTNWTNFWENPGNAIERLAAAGGLLYFSARAEAAANSLWRIDPATLAVTKVVDGQIHRVIGDHAGGAIYYRIDNANAAAYWRYDPIAGAPVQLAPTTTQLDYNSLSFANVGGGVFYFADGTHLSKSSGTAATTTQLDGLLAAAGLSNFDSLTDVDGLLYFAADHSQYGRELWETDGTLAGTELVADIDPTLSSSPAEIFKSGNRLFAAATTREFGRELWVGDLPLDGDYDGTGFVDGGDILALQRSLGSHAVPAGSGADGDSSGMVDAADLEMILEHYGDPSASVLAVTAASSSFAAAIDAQARDSLFAAGDFTQIGAEARSYRPPRRTRVAP